MKLAQNRNGHQESVGLLAALSLGCGSECSRFKIFTHVEKCVLCMCKTRSF